MANPAIVACAVSTWVKVATSVAAGMVHIVTTAGSGGEHLVYLQTYRITGGAVPTLVTEGVPLIGLSTPIQSSFDIDVYIMAIGAAGSIRIDV
jgi:hypothetical protein